MRDFRFRLSALVLIAGLLSGARGDVEEPASPAKAAAAKPTPAGVVAGKVLDGKGAPVGGAQVTLHRHHDAPSGRWGRFVVAHGPVTVDRTGAFRFTGLDKGYYMVSVERNRFARAFHSANLDEGQTQELDVVLKPPVSATISVVDESGMPVAGATVREYRQRGANGGNRFPQIWLPSLGLRFPPSDSSGRIELPAFPEGDVLDLVVEHPTLAPAGTGDLTLAQGATARATMKPGVVLTLRVPVDRPDERISTAAIDLRPDRDGFSFITHYELPFDAEGKARLAVEPGPVHWLLLEHEKFFITPVYSGNGKNNALRIEPGRNAELNFEVHRKVVVRGRVVNEAGRPQPGISVFGELARGTMRGWDDLPPEWSFAGWAETDERGEYAIDLAAGAARLTFDGTGFLPEKERYAVSVAADGSTVVPDVRMRPLPKLTGLVRHADGSPVKRAVVRLAGRQAGTQPVLSDETGRFTIDIEWIATDEVTGKKILDQHLVAFDPYRPLSTRVPVRLDEAKESNLVLEPHDGGWPLGAFPEELTPWERGELPADEQTEKAAVSMRGKAPPEIDAVAWLNTDGRALGSNDLRGKYVLLDFWFIGCGPCHYDFPSVSLVHELYQDKVVVIGFHNNSQNAEAVREHVQKLGLKFPIAVDHPDGRTVAAFQKQRLAGGYPSYVLISPEGKVLLDDRTILHPSLRRYKVDILRKLLLTPGER